MSVSSPTARARPAVRTPRRAAGGLRTIPPAPAALAAGLGVAILYAAFASGATSLPAESRLQVGIAALSVAALAGLTFGRSLRAAAAPAAWAGLGLLAAFAAWTGLSLAWSIAPELSWVHLNRTVAYTLVVALGIVVGSSLPRAVERVALGYLALATLVALYALGGKVAPWLQIPGLIDLNHTADFSRLRAPLGYWNALGIFCVLAVPIALRTGADLERGRASRLAAQLTLVPLLVTVGLTYSRGGLAALAVGLAVVMAAGPDRLRLVAFGAIGVLGAAPPLMVAFARVDLTTDSLSVASRTDDGLLLLGALVIGMLVVVALATLLRRADDLMVLTQRGRRIVRRAVMAGAATVVLLFAAGLATSERGIGGTISGEFESFTSTKLDRQNDPARLLQANSGNRWVWWQEAGGAWWDRPVLGHGAGSFPLVHLAYREDELQVRQAHSVPLQFLAETGLVGALLALGGLGLLAFAGVRRALGSTARERPYAMALVAATAAWGLHMWVDWDWDIPAVTLPLLVFLGVLAGLPTGRGGAEVVRRRGRESARTAGSGLTPGSRAGILALGTALACVACVSFVLPSLARDRTSSALTGVAGGSPEALAQAATDAEAARRLNPLAVEPIFAAATIAERRGRFAEASELLAEAVRRQPNNPQAWLRVANFNVKRDDFAAALRAAGVVLRLDPRSDVARLIFLFADPSGRSATATGTPLPEAVPEPRVDPQR